MVSQKPIADIQNSTYFIVSASALFLADILKIREGRIS